MLIRGFRETQPTSGPSLGEARDRQIDICLFAWFAIKWNPLLLSPPRIAPALALGYTVPGVLIRDPMLCTLSLVSRRNPTPTIQLKRVSNQDLSIRSTVNLTDWRMACV